MFIKIYYDNFPVLEQVNLMVLLMVRMCIPFKYCAVETVADAVESVLLAKDFMIFQLRSGQVVDTVERIHFDVEPL